MFDLLKNKEHDKISSVVRCLICKTVFRTGQIGDKGQSKTEIIVPHKTTIQLFVSHTSRLKYLNSLLCIKNCIRPKVIQYHKSLSSDILPCIMLFFLVLFYSLLSV